MGAQSVGISIQLSDSEAERLWVRQPDNHTTKSLSGFIQIEILMIIKQKNKALLYSNFFYPAAQLLTVFLPSVCSLVCCLNTMGIASYSP